MYLVYTNNPSAWQCLINILHFLENITVWTFTVVWQINQTYSGDAMTKWFIFFFFLSLLISAPVFGQITIGNNGHIAIGTEQLSDKQKLKVRCTGCDQTSYANYAIHAETATSSSTFSYGVYGTALLAWYSTGVRGHANGTSISRGIMGSASGDASQTLGGYFTQGIYVSGGITQASDERLKADITDVNRESITEKVNQLRPVRYRYLNADELRMRGMPASHNEGGRAYWITGTGS